MTRPLERLGILELEDLFQKRVRTSATVFELMELEGELVCRSTAKAAKLLVEVKKRLKVKEVIATADTIVAEKQPVQLELPSATDFELSFSAPAPSIQAASFSAVVTPTPAPPKTPSTSTAAVMSKERAFKILKVSPTTSWEQIEQSRRELVARAQPDKLAELAADKRRALQDECQQVNDAYKSLLQAEL